MENEVITVYPSGNIHQVVSLYFSRNQVRNRYLEIEVLVVAMRIYEITMQFNKHLLSPYSLQDKVLYVRATKKKKAKALSSKRGYNTHKDKNNIKSNMMGAEEKCKLMLQKKIEEGEL